MNTDTDVVVVGGGPAGWAIAAALHDQEVSVVLVAPDPGAAWPATYGVWVDDLPQWVMARWSAHDHAPLLRHLWPQVRVAGHALRVVNRAYGRVDNAVLHQILAPVTTMAASVRGATHHRWGSRVHTTSGDVTAGLVIDATGAAGVLSPAIPSDAAQVAYGVVVPSEAVPEPFRAPDTCTLMDWRPMDGAVGGADGAGDATFLYVLDDGAHALLEETSLVCRPPRSPDELRRRLAQRLGVDLTADAVDVERVHIPMASGWPRHRRGDRVVAFGAASGYVHPATGYSLAASLRAAPRVADAVVATLQLADRDAAATRVAAAVWPVAQRRVRALHDVGLAALERLDGHGLRTFFDAFFELPTDQWSAYLRVDADPGAITAAMTGVFRHLPWRQRWTLMRARPTGLLAAVAPGGS